MIHIAFCFPKKSVLHAIQQEITLGFSQRGISIYAIPASHPKELLHYHISQGILPDIVLFSEDNNTKDLLQALLPLKELNHTFSSILVKYATSDALSLCKDFCFLLSPFYEVCLTSRHGLWSCVSRAYDLSIYGKDTFSYYHRPRYHSMPISQILYFASDKRCVRLVTKNSSDSFYGRLTELEELLVNKNGIFVRIHQSYLVNIAAIATYGYQSVTLFTGETLNISKPDYYHQLKSVMLDQPLTQKGHKTTV